MKKYYAVKSNTISFIAESWEEAKEKMVGLKEISHKSFTSYEDAKAFLEGNDNKPRFYSEAVAYIDGSYDVKTGAYSFGGVLIYNNTSILVLLYFSIYLFSIYSNNVLLYFSTSIF